MLGEFRGVAILCVGSQDLCTGFAPWSVAPVGCRVESESPSRLS